MVYWLTDDMEIAPDFFEYFEAAAKLLETDKYVTTVLCFILTWQDSEIISSVSNYVTVIVVVLKVDNGCFFME